MEFKDPIVCGETVHTVVEVISVQEKAKGCLVTLKTTTANEKGEIKVINEGTTFNRGASAKKTISCKQSKVDLTEEEQRVFNGKPDFSTTFKTTENQAALYRLSGDLNPLHMYPSI